MPLPRSTVLTSSYASGVLTINTPSPRSVGDVLVFFLAAIPAANSISPLGAGIDTPPEQFYRSGEFSPGARSGWLISNPDVDSIGHRYWPYIFSTFAYQSFAEYSSIGMLARVVDGSEASSYTFTVVNTHSDPFDSTYAYWGFALVLPPPHSFPNGSILGPGTFPQFLDQQQTSNYADPRTYNADAGFGSNLVDKYSNGQQDHTQLRQFGRYDAVNRSLYLPMTAFSGDTSYGDPKGTISITNIRRQDMANGGISSFTGIAGSIPAGTYKIVCTRSNVAYDEFFAAGLVGSGIYSVGQSNPNVGSRLISSPNGSQALRIFRAGLSTGQTGWNVYVAPCSSVSPNNNTFGTGGNNVDGYFLQNTGGPIATSATTWDWTTLVTGSATPANGDTSQFIPTLAEFETTKGGMYLYWNVSLDLFLPVDLTNAGGPGNNVSYSQFGPNIALPTPPSGSSYVWGEIADWVFQTPPNITRERAGRGYLKLGPAISTRPIMGGMVG